MPPDAIRAASKDVLAGLKRNDIRGVWVPRADTKPCLYEKPKSRQHGTWMPLTDLGDILSFVLDNALVRMPDRRILRQTVGIPMGGPISPGMCNATCAWMEREWLLGIDDLSRKMFAGMRYMDDILLITTKDARFDESKFLKDFQSSSCYWNPMSLEDASNGTYLETTYEVANGKELSHRLKNANETESKVWRYHHYNSRLDYTTKRAILFSTLRKVHKMASNSKQLHISAIAKCKEYIKLHYPVGILKYMCSIMARETANHIWLQVRREL